MSWRMFPQIGGSSLILLKMKIKLFEKFFFWINHIKLLNIKPPWKFFSKTKENLINYWSFIYFLLLFFIFLSFLLHFNGFYINLYLCIPLQPLYFTSPVWNINDYKFSHNFHYSSIKKGWFKLYYIRCI